MHDHERGSRRESSDPARNACEIRRLLEKLSAELKDDDATGARARHYIKPVRSSMPSMMFRF